MREEPPATPGSGEVLARSVHIGVCASDTHAFAGRHPHISLPYLPGHEATDVVEELGEGVTSVAILGAGAIGLLLLAVAPAVERLFEVLGDTELPETLIGQYLGARYEAVRKGRLAAMARPLAMAAVESLMQDYISDCE